MALLSRDSVREVKKLTDCYSATEKINDVIGKCKQTIVSSNHMCLQFVSTNENTHQLNHKENILSFNSARPARLAWATSSSLKIET